MISRNTKTARTGRSSRKTTLLANRAKPSSTRIDLTLHRHPLKFRWAAAISEEEWVTYRLAMETARNAGVQYMLGGGFALAAYTGRWRDTKDIDFYILPQDRQKTVDALSQAGFKDYFHQRPYDRNWIYRSVQRDVIVDIIWAMANQRARVDQEWFDRAGQVSLRSQQLKVIPAEEFIWCKLYIMQRDHCDWTDIFNLLYSNGPEIDWPHLIKRVDEDEDLLRAMLNAYAWLCPKKVRELPSSLWQHLGMEPPPRFRGEPGYDRVRLLDSRNWFAGHRTKTTKLDV